ncbi:uncharacterized protein LOC129310613 isoform X3 [Prosopis cineraria]|uniref:uncharacterized protein LOC129310613 isoform X3 n=1 Tax=Prosopis cineraria TaxID=364024 RepID=UPI00240FCC8D|nr:uncharacterized protein LOC129310613 isoform X3 [Prosopis cineraria]
MKGLVERYKRWNRVHPTYGAFWGIGVGIGCGIGWGPGFGPEAIGYVGAGCGIGFGVGFTLAGLGIGLPVNFIFQVPYNGDGWTGIAPHVSELLREASEKFSSFRQQHLSVKGTDLFAMKNSLPLLATSACESFRALNTQFFSLRRGLESQNSMTGTSSATMQHTFCQEPLPTSKKPALVLITPYYINGRNYLQWSSSLIWSASARGKANKLTRSAALSSVDDAKYATCEAETSLALSWLINSMTIEIGKNFLLSKIAHGACTIEKASCSSVNNKAILFGIECFLHDFRQGNLDVTQYYNVLLRQWQKWDLYEIHQWYCETDAQYYNTLKEEKRVYKFLIGLNPIFEAIRNHIMSLDPLPTLEEVFFVVKREESRKRPTPNTSTAYAAPESSTLVAEGARSDDYKLKKI